MPLGQSGPWTTVPWTNVLTPYGQLIDQGWALTLWGLALVCQESPGMFFYALNGKTQPIQAIFSCGPMVPPKLIMEFAILSLAEQYHTNNF